MCYLHANRLIEALFFQTIKKLSVLLPLPSLVSMATMECSIILDIQLLRKVVKSLKTLILI